MISVRPIGRRSAGRVRALWCHFCHRLLGLEVTYRGEPIDVCATLYVANHVSLLDILLLGRCLDATFIADALTPSHPLLGAMGAVTGTFFIRRRRLDALVQRHNLAARMRAGESFVLFARGTSPDGLPAWPLETSLLSVAEPWVLDRPVAVQPVTLVYRQLADGRACPGDTGKPHSWYGERALISQLWALLQDDGWRIEVVLGEPVLSWAVTSRKTLGPALRLQMLKAMAAGHALLPSTGSKAADATQSAPRQPAA